MGIVLVRLCLKYGSIRCVTSWIFPEARRFRLARFIPLALFYHPVCGKLSGKPVHSRIIPLGTDATSEKRLSVPSASNTINVRKDLNQVFYFKNFHPKNLVRLSILDRVVFFSIELRILRNK